MKLRLNNGKEIELLLVEGAIKGSVDLVMTNSEGQPYAGGHILQITTNGKLFRHWNLDRNKGLVVENQSGYFQIEEADMQEITWKT